MAVVRGGKGVKGDAKDFSLNMRGESDGAVKTELSIREAAAKTVAATGDDDADDA